MKLGLTFSQRQLESLGLPVGAALDRALALDLDIIRLGAYWNELEPEKGKYNFKPLTDQLEKCEQQDQAVLLTIGAKAPRYPEFYLPSWLNATQDQVSTIQLVLFRFIKHLITAVGHFKCISHWQVENEPLDPSGPFHQTVPLEVLTKEVELVRSLDPRPILINIWGNQYRLRPKLKRVSPLADVIGLDLYYQQYLHRKLGKSIYKGPSRSGRYLTKKLSLTKKPIWITELQAEPWEADQTSYLSPNPESMSPGKLRRFFHKAAQLPIETIIFWGFEYWYFQEIARGNFGYFNIIKEWQRG